MAQQTVSLGDIVHLFFEEYMALYDDGELAAVAAAATVNDLLSRAENSIEDLEEEE